MDGSVKLQILDSVDLFKVFFIVYVFLNLTEETQEATTRSDTGPLKWMAPESLIDKK